MNQKKHWKQYWNRERRSSPNDFAKKSFSEMENKSFNTLLDVGCGIGLDSIFFAQKGFSVTSLDFSESGIQCLKQTIKSKNINNITPMLGDISDFKFAPNSFDVIYAHLSLQYFNDQTTTRIFSDLYKMLKPKGLIFIKCKSVSDPLYGEGEKIGNDLYIHNDHVRHFFSKKYMTEKLNKFKMVKIKETSSTLYKSSFIEAVATK